MHQNIIAFSGKKCAGKSTIANFLIKWCNDNKVGSCLKVSFADEIKEFCINVLGLDEKQCYGTDAEKKFPTKYKWEHLEPYLQWKFGNRLFYSIGRPSIGVPNDIQHSDRLMREWYWKNINLDFQPLGMRFGYMTGRDIMQVYGTELIRENFGNVWAQATIRRIKRLWKSIPESRGDNTVFSMPTCAAFIDDNRFPDEISAVTSEPNGYIVRLTRNVYEDTHDSETALDGYSWLRERHFVINNAHMTIDEQNAAALNLLKPILVGK